MGSFGAGSVRMRNTTASVALTYTSLMPVERYIESSELRAFRAEGSIKPRVQIADEFSIIAAQFKRIFPLSKPDEFISVQDGAGKEVGILKAVQGLDQQTAGLIAE